jgi:hypothetical protein
VITAPRVLALCLVALAYLSFQRWEQRPVDTGPGVLAPDTPRQVELRQAEFPFKGYTLKPRAGFDLEARVLSAKQYHFGDGADLVPIDVAFGWGPMSDDSVLQHIQVSQSGRWYHLRWQQAPLPEQQIMRHSGNMHLIPADSFVAHELHSLREGQVVQLQGQLVDARRDDGWSWKTSLSRDDVGGGSCELFFVERVVFSPPGS